jgi:hypothetical protein
MVLRPKGRYNGHIPTRLVRTNTPASTSKTIPRVPETMWVKYNTATATAIRILTTLSIVPMFLFIIDLNSIIGMSFLTLMRVFINLSAELPELLYQMFDGVTRPLQIEVFPLSE